MLKMVRARAGQIIGRDHMARQANCQDSYALAQTETCIAGVVCDGCGEGQHSEVGSTLAAKYIVTQILAMLEEGCPLETIPTMLYQRVVGYLDELVALSAPMNTVQFVQHHLLFTIVGVILTEQGGLIFSSGDGLIVVDDHVTPIDQRNKPAYIAYHLIREHVVSLSVIQHNFIVQTLENWERIVIATDGFNVDLLPQVQGLKHPRSLQRKLNVWSNQERHFKDDATLIVIEKVEDDDAGTD
jgi:serine/threonine protein phosphatase PrpC